MVLTMACVVVLSFAAVVYTASYIHRWVGTTATTAVASTSCNAATSSQALTQSGITLNVYNSTDREGLAKSAAGALERQGFKIARIDNDPLGKTIMGVGEIRHGPSGLEGANLATLRLSGATLVQDSRMDTSVDLVVGNAFTEVKVPPKIAATPKTKPTPRC